MNGAEWCGFEEIRAIERAARQHLRLDAGDPVRCEIRMRPGLETGVAIVTARGTDGTGRGRVMSFIAKPLPCDGREAAVYRWLSRSGLAGLAPALLASADSERGQLLLLSRVRAISWPWRSVEPTGRVLDALAELHARGDRSTFEASVAPCAAADVGATMQAVELTRRAVPASRAALRPVFRVAERLPEIQRQIACVLPPAVLHGDVHPGNVLISAARRRDVQLLDWSRARTGSPLEDVCSWLQSLAYWEPETRRRHDTLLRRYLSARGIAAGPGPTLRSAYWLAGALNAFGGALRYHLYVAMNPALGAPERERARRAAADWLRIVRRASIAIA